MSEKQQLWSQWKAELRRCLAALAADPLPSLLEEATLSADQSQRALDEFHATAAAAATDAAAIEAQVNQIQLEWLQLQLILRKQERQLLQSRVDALRKLRSALQQALNARSFIASWEAVQFKALDVLHLLQQEYVSADTTAALARLLQLQLQPTHILIGMLPYALQLLAGAGFNSLLEKLLREPKAYVNQAMRWKEGHSLLDSLVSDPQRSDQATHKNSIDMRPLCSLFQHGLDPTLITPPHATSPLQRARQAVRAMSDEQIIQLDQRLTQLTAWMPQQAGDSRVQARDIVDELIAFKRLHPCRLDAEWRALWRARRKQMLVAFSIELDRQWAAHSSRMRQLLLSDSMLLSSFGSFTRDLTPIICAYVGVDLERPLPDDAAATEDAANDQSTDAESDVTMAEAQPSVEQKEAQ